MQDQVIKGTGNSRYLKSSIPEDITLSELVALLRAGTFPIDLNGLNEEGIQTLGTPLNTATLLSGTTSQAFGYRTLPAGKASTVNDVLYGLSLKIGGQAPTEQTVGQLGQCYWCTGNEILFKCINISGGKYTWRKINEAYKVGDILNTLRLDLDQDWLLANGSIINESDYPELYGWLTTYSGTPQKRISGTGLETPPESGLRNINFNEAIVKGDYIFFGGTTYSNGYKYIYIFNKNTLEYIKSVAGYHIQSENFNMVYASEYGTAGSIVFMIADSKTVRVCIVDVSTLEVEEYTHTSTNSYHYYHTCRTIYDPISNAVVLTNGSVNPGQGTPNLSREIFYLGTKTFAAEKIVLPVSISEQLIRKSNGEVLYINETHANGEGTITAYISNSILDTTIAKTKVIGSFSYTGSSPVVAVQEIDGSVYFIVKDSKMKIYKMLGESMSLLLEVDNLKSLLSLDPIIAIYKNRYFILGNKYIYDYETGVLTYIFERVINIPTGSTNFNDYTLKIALDNYINPKSSSTATAPALMPSELITDANGDILYISWRYDDSSFNYNDVCVLNKVLPVITSDNNYVYIKAKEG